MVPFEVQDIVQVGAAPPIDRLVVVAYHTEIAVSARQQMDEAVLGMVGILVLID